MLNDCGARDAGHSTFNIHHSPFNIPHPTGGLLRRFAIVTLLSLLALPALAQPCNLQISMTCTAGQCTATTLNAGNTSCSGEYIAGFFTDQTNAVISGTSNSLGLSLCLDSNAAPAEEAS